MGNRDNVYQGAIPANSKEIDQAVALMGDFHRMSIYAPASVMPALQLNAAQFGNMQSTAMTGYAVEKLRMEVHSQSVMLQDKLNAILQELRREG